MDGNGPAAREDHTWTLAEDGRTAWLFGGRDGATVFDDLWTFDLEASSWTRQRIDGQAPPARFGHEAAWLPGRGLLIWAGQAGATFFDDAWLLDRDAGWERLETRGDAPIARYGSCSGIGPDGRFWISHGFTENGVRFDDTRALDLDELRWTDETPRSDDGPIKRCLHGCWWTSDGRFALYGGQTNGVPALGDLWFLTPGPNGSGGWTEAPGQEAAARQLPAIARRGDVTVIVGGRDLDGTARIDAWVVEDGSSTLAPLLATDPPAHRSGAALIHDPATDGLLMFGGRGGGALDDLWELRFP